MKKYSNYKFTFFQVQFNSNVFLINSNPIPITNVILVLIVAIHVNFTSFLK